MMLRSAEPHFFPFDVPPELPCYFLSVTNRFKLRKVFSISGIFAFSEILVNQYFQNAKKRS
jgi:hypothetical protein